MAYVQEALSFHIRVPIPAAYILSTACLPTVAYAAYSVLEGVPVYSQHILCAGVESTDLGPALARFARSLTLTKII